MPALTYEHDPFYGCHLWTGAKSNSGYGYVWAGKGQGMEAHRYAWELANGPLPPDRELDHLCRRRLCVNPAHLEAVTRRENEKRKRWAYRAQMKRCPKGHDLFTHGRRTPEAGMVCRLCCGL